MRKYIIKHTDLIGSDTLLLTLQPQRQKDTLRFYPGQYAAISFKTSTRPTPARCFSIVSSPHNAKTLQFAMRVRGSFTQTASQLAVGTEVFVRGPFGDFVIDPELDRNIIMLAGGIGITPFMSMIRFVTETKLDLPISLFYSCKSQDDIPFYDELVSLEQQNPNFKVAFFITTGATNKLKSARVVSGRIDEPRLSQVTGDNNRRFTYFICGPKSFLYNLESTLLESGAHPDRIITEAFSQASKAEAITSLPRFSVSQLTYAMTGIALIAGTGFIMALDLSRSLPKLSQAAASSPSSTSSNNTQVQTTPTIQSTVQPTQTYQPPTTSVS